MRRQVKVPIEYHIYVKAGTPARISVPVHAGDLKRGLQKYLMKTRRFRILNYSPVLLTAVLERRHTAALV